MSMLTQKVNVTINDVAHDITIFTLIQWKHAIKLEMLGMTHSKGNVCAHVKKLFGIPLHTKRQVVLDHIMSVLEQIEDHFGIAKEVPNA